LFGEIVERDVGGHDFPPNKLFLLLPCSTQGVVQTSMATRERD